VRHSGRGGTDWLWGTERPRGRERRWNRNRERESVCVVLLWALTHKHTFTHTCFGAPSSTCNQPGYPFTRCIPSHSLNCPSRPAALAWIVDASTHNTQIVLLACNKTCTLRKNAGEHCSTHTRTSCSCSNSYYEFFCCYCCCCIASLKNKKTSVLIIWHKAWLKFAC